MSIINAVLANGEIRPAIIVKDLGLANGTVIANVQIVKGDGFEPPVAQRQLRYSNVLGEVETWHNVGDTLLPSVEYAKDSDEPPPAITPQEGETEAEMKERINDEDEGAGLPPTFPDEVTDEVVVEPVEPAVAPKPKGKAPAKSPASKKKR